MKIGWRRCLSHFLVFPRRMAFYLPIMRLRCFSSVRHILLKSQLKDFFEDDSPIFGLLRRLSASTSVGEQEMTLLSPRLGKKLVTIQIAKALKTRWIYYIHANERCCRSVARPFQVARCGSCLCQR